MNFGNITLRKRLVNEQFLLETMPATKTPSKQNLRKSTMPQSLGRPMRRTRTRRLSSYDTARDFAVEVLNPSRGVLKDLTLDENKKQWQKCFVNIEYLTPNKLNLVKTVTSPLVELKKEIVKRASTKNINCNELLSSTEKENVDVASCMINNNDNEFTTGTINKDKLIDEPDIVSDTLNDTFTMLPETGDVTVGNDTTFTLEEIEQKESPPPRFSDLKIQKFDDIETFDVAQPKRLSISQRLSKSMRPLKSQKQSNMSKVTKSSRLSSVASARVPKISNSKAIQLYEFLSNGQVDKTAESDTKEQAKPFSILESPPSGNSTPKILKNHPMKSLLKSTLRKNNVSFADQPSIISTSCANETSKIPKATYRRMPNFAAIHKKTFGKMENISDYQQRKSERAKLLLSGSKPPKTSPVMSTPKNKEIKKGLLQSFNKTRDTPIKKDLNQTQPSHSMKECIKIDNPTRINQISTDKTPIKAQPTKLNNLMTTSQTNSSISSSKSACPKGKIALTRFGFKVPVVNKEEIVKAIMTKTRTLPANHTKNEQRSIIKGVRSNRRFDLLMKMRLNK